MIFQFPQGAVSFARKGKKHRFQHIDRIIPDSSRCVLMDIFQVFVDIDSLYESVECQVGMVFRIVKTTTKADLLPYRVSNPLLLARGVFSQRHTNAVREPVGHPTPPKGF